MPDDPAQIERTRLLLDGIVQQVAPTIAGEKLTFPLRGIRPKADCVLRLRVEGVESVPVAAPVVAGADLGRAREVGLDPEQLVTIR